MICISPQNSNIINIKQNPKAFSLNAVFDVRRRLDRRHEMTYFINSETIKASRFKLYQSVALDSTVFAFLPEMTPSSSYFQSAANPIKVFILGHVRVAISQ